MIASAVKNLLCVLGYPSLPLQSNLLGEFRVGVWQTRIPGGTACQIHYPTTPEDEETNTKTTSTSPPPPYIRPEAIQGLADYTRQPATLLQFLSQRPHPGLWQATPVPKRQFPVVIFSHGLGGCMEMYTELCMQIASFGYWVIALEHQDGSAAYACCNDEQEGTTLYYKRPDDTPYSRQKVVNFRRAFLQQRVQEIDVAVNHIHAQQQQQQEQPTGNTGQVIWQAADTSQGVHLLGHSFGGATMVLAAQNNSPHKVASLNLLDCWAFSLDDNVLEQACGDIATLSIISEAWLTNPETAQVQQLLQNSKNVAASLYCPASKHVSFSDATNWFPGFVARSLSLRAPAETSHGTIRTVARACAQHIMRQCQPAQEEKEEKEAFEGLEEYPVDAPVRRQPQEAMASS